MRSHNDVAQTLQQTSRYKQQAIPRTSVRCGGTFDSLSSLALLPELLLPILSRGGCSKFRSIPMENSQPTENSTPLENATSTESQLIPTSTNRMPMTHTYQILRNFNPFSPEISPNTPKLNDSKFAPRNRQKAHLLVVTRR